MLRIVMGWRRASGLSEGEPGREDEVEMRERKWEWE